MVKKMTFKKSVIYYQNVRGLRTKSTTFLKNLTENNYDCICLTETWLNGDHSNSDYFTRNYNVFRSDRTTLSRGGGALIAIKDSYNVLRRSDLEYQNEDVWVEIKLNSQERLLLGCIYFSRNITLSVYQTFINKLNNQLKNFHGDIIILGDFNLPGVNWKHGNPNECRYKGKAKCILNLSTSNELKQLNFKKNRFDVNLDLILVNNDKYIANHTTVKALVPEDGNHPVLSIEFRIEATFQ